MGFATKRKRRFRSTAPSIWASCRGCFTIAAAVFATAQTVRSVEIVSTATAVFILRIDVASESVVAERKGSTRVGRIRPVWR